MRPSVTASWLTAPGYDRATIRSIAAAAEVDAGLVMHYFGSKQELYRQVIDAAPVPEVSGTPAEAAEQILAGLADRLASAPAASLALLRSMLTNPDANPDQIIHLLRPCLLSLTTRRDHGERP